MRVITVEDGACTRVLRDACVDRIRGERSGVCHSEVARLGRPPVASDASNRGKIETGPTQFVIGGSLQGLLVPTVGSGTVTTFARTRSSRHVHDVDDK